MFFRLKLLPWNWITGTVTVLVRVLLCAVFVGLLSSLAPTGRVTVISQVVEVTPNVSGQIADVPVQPNQLVKAGTVLFKIDPTPYETQVRKIDAQLRFQELRLAQMKQLQAGGRGAHSTSSSVKPRSRNCVLSSITRNTTSTRRPSAPQPMAMSAA